MLSLKKDPEGWTYVEGESRCYDLTEAYDYNDLWDLSKEARNYRSLQALVEQYDAELVAPDGYFSKLGLGGVTLVLSLMTVPTGYDYVQYEGWPFDRVPYIQSPVTAFICDAFNYAAESQVSALPLAVMSAVRSYQGEYTVADAFNQQSTGESAVDHSAGSSLAVCDLSGTQLAAICILMRCALVSASGDALWRRRNAAQPVGCLPLHHCGRQDQLRCVQHRSLLPGTE